jgi:hypothetical protein
MKSPFTGAGGNLTGFAKDVRAVTPSNDADLDANLAAIALICKGSAGDVSIVTASGETRTYPIGEGETLPVGVVRVRASGTTATALYAFFA